MRIAGLTLEVKYGDIDGIHDERLEADLAQDRREAWFLESIRYYHGLEDTPLLRAPTARRPNRTHVVPRRPLHPSPT